jgi:hypothetical protein
MRATTSALLTTRKESGTMVSYSCAKAGQPTRGAPYEYLTRRAPRNAARKRGSDRYAAAPSPGAAPAAAAAAALGVATARKGASSPQRPARMRPRSKAQSVASAPPRECPVM